jgi:hypothetical protein
VSTLYRAKRLLESVAGPVSFERGEFYASNPSCRGETHYVLASVRVQDELVEGTGRTHLEAIEETSLILRDRTLHAIREGLGDYLYDEAKDRGTEA